MIKQIWLYSRALCLSIVALPAAAASPPVGGVHAPSTIAEFKEIIRAPLGRRTFAPVILPKPLAAFGARCDGVTDTTRQVKAALAADVPLTGESKTCAVRGNIQVPDHAWIQDVTFKQLSSNHQAVRTLQISEGAGPVALVRVKIDRNGLPSDTSHVLQAAGIYFAGKPDKPLAGIFMQDVEVFGSGAGSGIIITDAASPVIIRPNIHDMYYSAAVDPCIEQIVGLSFTRTTDVYVEDPVITDLGGTIEAGVPSGACSNQAQFEASISGTTMTVRTVESGTIRVNNKINSEAGNIVANTKIVSGAGGGPGTYALDTDNGTLPTERITSGGTGSWSPIGKLRYYQSDCLDIGGRPGGAVIIGGSFTNCGEGSDMGGTLGVENIWMYHPYYSTDSIGFKLNNGARNINVIDGKSKGTGLWGAGVGSSIDPSTHIHLINWASIDTGGNNDYWAGNHVSGVSLISGGRIPIDDFVCSHCIVTDKQAKPTTQYGFWNQPGLAKEMVLDKPVVDVAGGAFISAFSCRHSHDAC